MTMSKLLCTLAFLSMNLCLNLVSPISRINLFSGFIIATDGPQKVVCIGIKKVPFSSDLRDTFVANPTIGELWRWVLLNLPKFAPTENRKVFQKIIARIAGMKISWMTWRSTKNLSKSNNICIQDAQDHV